jgi:hypothetical protein
MPRHVWKLLLGKQKEILPGDGRSFNGLTPQWYGQWIEVRNISNWRFVGRKLAEGWWLVPEQRNQDI